MGNLCCCFQVDQSTMAIREQFGKFDSVLEPGCHCLPWIFGKHVVGHLTLRLQQLDVRCETKTKDNVFVGRDECSPPPQLLDLWKDFTTSQSVRKVFASSFFSFDGKITSLFKHLVRDLSIAL